MNLLDTLLPIVGALVWLTLLTVVVVAFYRRFCPYKVVGHSPSMGLIGVRWRDDPKRTHWLTPAHLAQQKGLHR
ncbi:hypothetical protein [Nonomuraea zeae]|uniref:Uncharacterized protein n=1 Tax=Nonomuraea zeae TaxID=1642303 RepID=A0A5S4H3A5_9ACTN|nr:hypothetical protein [Nonomuraea zeae]TMR39586.1 hypothetical protein ETD85_00810 [Nonomuraea zeae]